MQKTFAAEATRLLAQEEEVLGLAAAGSWLTGELDAYSDLDLILVTKEKISHEPRRMLAYARKLGNLLHGFTGEHVGEPRVLICLYDAPLLHVDIKFLTADELKDRIEDPEILLDKEGRLAQVIHTTRPKPLHPDYQWIEDRFWIWVHYALLKIGRGEYLEAYDFFGYLRMVVLGPLLQVRNGLLPRGVRKVETGLSARDLRDLLGTLPEYNGPALLNSLERAVALYRGLRSELFPATIQKRQSAEDGVMNYFLKIREEGKALS